MASFPNNEKEETASSTQNSGGDNEAIEERAHAVVQMPPDDDQSPHQPLPLQWTQMGQQQQQHDTPTPPPVRYPADVAEILPEDTEICIVGTAGQKITHIGNDFSCNTTAPVNPNLTQLILRSHLIRTMEGLEHFVGLELLELYDNQVDALQCLDKGENGRPGTTLRTLDMSYNVIREMKPVSLCPNLTELCTYTFMNDCILYLFFFSRFYFHFHFNPFFRLGQQQTKNHRRPPRSHATAQN